MELPGSEALEILQLRLNNGCMAEDKALARVEPVMLERDG